MNSTILYTKRFIFIYLLTSGLSSYAQDTTQAYTPEASFFTTATVMRFQPCFNYMHHSPSGKDQDCYRNYKSLLTQQPTLKNCNWYFSLACALWELDKTADAEKMFLTIVHSKEEFYASTYYHSSDIPGDKTKNRYGYGNFTSNYKHYAAIYLTKIYLEQKAFDKALQYLEDAVDKYKVTYSCGTGFHRQQDEYDFLFASCYAGLNRQQEVLDLLLPHCLERRDELIIAAIKNMYSQQEIQENLKNGESSIECSQDSFPSYAYRVTYSDGKKEMTDTIQYFSGTATITLFDKQIDMPVPNIENGERLARDQFIKLFKASDFYTRLKNDR